MSKGRANKRRLVPVKKAKKKINYKKAVIVSCAAFVGFVIILASVLGIYSAVRQRSYYMYYGGVGIDEGIVNFFSAAYKSTYLRELNKAEGVEHKDAEELWQSKMADGKTYGEDLKARTENYLKKLVAANAIFDLYARLGSQDKDKINKAIEDKLGNYNFSVAEFNKAAAPYGFDYSDFKVATEMLYKQKYASSIIFGSDGLGVIEYPELHQLCQDYLESYSYVHLVFIRDYDTFVLDENGNLVKENGVDKLRPKTSKEIEKAEKAKAAIRAAMAGINEGKVAPEKFFELQKEYDEGDKAYHEVGYYLKEETAFTADMNGRFEGLLDAANALEIGKCEEIATEFGVCFIYRADIPDGAYLEENASLTEFFSFAGKAVYATLRAEYTEKVEIRDKWESADPSKIPHSTEFVAGA